MSVPAFSASRSVRTFYSSLVLVAANDRVKRTPCLSCWLTKWTFYRLPSTKVFHRDEGAAARLPTRTVSFDEMARRAPVSTSSPTSYVLRIRATRAWHSTAVVISSLWALHVAAAHRACLSSTLVGTFHSSPRSWHKATNQSVSLPRSCFTRKRCRTHPN